MIFNLHEMDGPLGHYHRVSLYFLLPYLATSLPLLWYNWYPSKVFPGDTFCYFSGMTFAVVAILGHFSKTLLLFFIPQVLNFLYSTPQLFNLVPCPRHRLPRYNKETDKVYMSLTTFKKTDLKCLFGVVPMGSIAIRILAALRVIHIEVIRNNEEEYVEMNNLTLINFILNVYGPMMENHLTSILLIIQVLCSAVAFGIRYPLALQFYGEVVA